MRPSYTPPRQQTLRRSVAIDGIGIHSGAPARLTLHPADAGTGIVFHRTELPGNRDRFIPARLTHTVSKPLATRLADQHAPAETVGTVEHVLAALHALGVDNALLEIDGPEVPIGDGSALPFVQAVADVGLCSQRPVRRVLEVLAPVRVMQGSAFAELRPAPTNALTLDVSIAFDNPVVGAQHLVATLDSTSFRHALAPARTFGFLSDAERLWREGFARGASFENTVIVSPDRTLNPGGLRFPDEFVRHKMLDAVGDLALAGVAIHGTFRSHRGGHALNRAVLRALMANKSAWRMVGEAGQAGTASHRSGQLADLPA